MRSVILSMSACAAVAIAACAQGGQLETSFGGAGGGSGGDGSGAGETTSTSTSSGTVSGSTSGTASSSSSSSSSTSSSSSSGSTSSSSGGTCNFNPPVDCPNAEVLQAIAGDEGSDSVTRTGTTSKWFSVLVEEAVSDPFDYPDLSYTATLTSPPGATYGLFVYPGNSSGPTCFAGAQQGTGNPAKVSDSWGDTPVLDDSTWITIEVRHLSGNACTPSDQWTLKVQGHTNP